MRDVFEQRKQCLFPALVHVLHAVITCCVLLCVHKEVWSEGVDIAVIVLYLVQLNVI